MSLSRLSGWDATHLARSDGSQRTYIGLFSGKILLKRLKTIPVNNLYVCAQLS